MIILDTSFLISFQVKRDVHHSRAVSVMGDIVRGRYGAAAISDYIFDETVTVTFSRTQNLRDAETVGEAMLKSYRKLTIDETIFDSAWTLFRGQRGTRLSFTDCTTVALMKEAGIGRIATFDQDFLRIPEISVVP